MSVRIPIPQVSKELVAFLDEQFPLREFMRIRSEAELRHLQGCREVIDTLKSIAHRQEDGNFPTYTKKEP